MIFTQTGLYIFVYSLIKFEICTRIIRIKNLIEIPFKLPVIDCMRTGNEEAVQYNYISEQTKGGYLS